MVLEALEQSGDRPPFRRLRGYAFDPSLSLKLDTASMNHTVFEVPWEAGLMPGPCGEYVEVVDYDPSSGCWYDPVDLNGIHLLAQDGYAPSEGNPQFHQQMVYAVAMNTISNFEHALGRQVLWSSQELPSKEEVFVKKLRIYPHAAAGHERLLQPEQEGAPVRLLPGADGDGVLLPVAGHRRPRNDPCAARRDAPPLHRRQPSRHAGLPRSLCRHGRAVPALYLPAGAQAPDRAYARRPADAVAAQ
ncbi:hypothetical protein LP420_34125 [Massilia sp. B-10]|nr:hypothetical protein LP420_34125 [Massilia sp. B-10]